VNKHSYRLETGLVYFCFMFQVIRIYLNGGSKKMTGSFFYT